jgi:hypothetical protein
MAVAGWKRDATPATTTMAMRRPGNPLGLMRMSGPGE